MQKEISLFITMLLMSISSVWAQGPPIFTETPIMLGVEGRGIRTFGNIVSKANGSAYIHPLAIPYNISAKWQVGAIVPFVYQAPTALPSRSGMGDMKAFTKYQLYQKNGKGKTIRSLIKLTETFPTGNSTKTPALGAGAWQTTLSLVNGYVTTKYGIYGEIGYNIAGAGLSDDLIYNVAAGFPLLPQKYPPNQLNLYLEFNGNYVFKDIGNNLFISPGIQYVAGRKLLFESGIQVSVDESAPESQQTKYILRIGTRVLIF